MINFFKENNSRDSALIFKSTFETIKKMYNQNPAQAGELAISAIELALTGEISSDDFYIDLILDDMKVINSRNNMKRDREVEASREKRMVEQKLDVIAELYLSGMKQKDIAVAIGTTPQTISKRMALIRTEYPDLLEKNQPNQLNQPNKLNQPYVDVDDNVDVDVDKNVLTLVADATLSAGAAAAMPYLGNF